MINIASPCTRKDVEKLKIKIHFSYKIEKMTGNIGLKKEVSKQILCFGGLKSKKVISYS